MDEERRKILTMLKNGEITIDEANSLLEELEQIQTEKTRKEDHVVYEVNPTLHVEYDSPRQEEKSFIESATDKLTNLFDQALKKLKDLDLDFYHSVEVDHVFQTNDTDFKDISVRIPFGSVAIATWDAAEVRAECKGKVYRTEDHTEGKEKFLESVELANKGQVLSLVSKDKWMKIDVVLYVPRKDYKNIYVKLLNGDITVEHLQADDWKLNSANGKIRLTGTSGVEGELETVNGIIMVTNSDFHELEAETVNGKINIDGSFKKVDLKTISGTINAAIKNNDVDTVRMESATGAIYLDIPENIPLFGEVKSNLGSFFVELADVHITDIKKEPIQKVSKFERGEQQENKLFIFAESKTGSIFVKEW